MVLQSSRTEKPKIQPVALESYTIDEGQEVGPRGAILNWNTEIIEDFPKSTCLKKAKLWTSKDTDLVVVIIYFRKESRYTVYEYQGALESIDHFKALVDAQESNKSVGSLFNSLFKFNEYYGRSRGIA